MIVEPAPDYLSETVEVLRGPNIKPFPVSGPLPESITTKAILKVGDNITTDHIMPAGAKILPYRSNIPYLSNFCFAVCDKTFPDRCKAEGGGIIIGGSNYGQGSSREHAPRSCRFTSASRRSSPSPTRASTARTSRTPASLRPARFKDEADYDQHRPDGRALPCRTSASAIQNKTPIILRDETKGIEMEVVPMMTRPASARWSSRAAC